MQHHDVDSDKELKRFVDGEPIGNAPKGRNNKWTSATLKLKGAKKPKLVEVEIKTTTKKDKWGSGRRAGSSGIGAGLSGRP